jgi:hypothetical protein
MTYSMPLAADAVATARPTRHPPMITARVGTVVVVEYCATSAERCSAYACKDQPRRFGQHRVGGGDREDPAGATRR